MAYQTNNVQICATFGGLLLVRGTVVPAVD